MTIKECILNNFKKCFLNTSIPSNEYFVEMVRNNILVKCEVITRDSNQIVLKLLFDDVPMKIKCVFKSSVGVTKFITQIEVID